MARVVKRLIAHPAVEGPVAHHRHHRILAAHQIPRPGHAQGRRNGCARMAGGKGVVFALLAARKAAQSARAAQGFKPFIPPGQYFMHIGLMAHVKDQLVLRGIEYFMHGQSKLNHAQIRRQMAAPFGNRIDQQPPDFTGQRLHFFYGHILQLTRFMNVFQHFPPYSSNKRRVHPNISADPA